MRIFLKNITVPDDRSRITTMDVEGPSETIDNIRARIRAQLNMPKQGFVVLSFIVKEEYCYLPKKINGHTVLVDEGDGKWRAENSTLQADASQGRVWVYRDQPHGPGPQLKLENLDAVGLSYRKAKDLGEVAWGELAESSIELERAVVVWGEQVQGSSEGDGWVKCKVKDRKIIMLEDGHTLGDYDIPDESTLMFTQRNGPYITLYVETHDPPNIGIIPFRGVKGKPWLTLYLPRSSTVLEAKNEIHDLSGVPAKFQRLTFAGKNLEDGHKLTDCNLEMESKLRVYFKGEKYGQLWKYSPRIDIFNDGIRRYIERVETEW
jgi:hypothetical protein